jgi:hypothetical protein
MAKKKIKYADETPDEPEGIVWTEEDFAKFHYQSLIRRYTTLYKSMIRMGATPDKAHAFATCTLVSENNGRLLSLLEDITGKQFPQ